MTGFGEIMKLIVCNDMNWIPLHKICDLYVHILIETDTMWLSSILQGRDVGTHSLIGENLLYDELLVLSVILCAVLGVDIVTVPALDLIQAQEKLGDFE